MIGSLLYLIGSSHDIMCCVCLCGRFQSSLSESHVIAVKQIFRYLLGTMNLGLWYLEMLLLTYLVFWMRTLLIAKLIVKVLLTAHVTS